jgi:hypothetical protein
MRTLLTILTLFVGFPFPHIVFSQTIFDGLEVQTRIDGFEHFYRGPTTNGFQFVTPFLGPDARLDDIPIATDICEVYRNQVSGDELLDAVYEGIIDSLEIGGGSIRERHSYICEIRNTIESQNTCGSDPAPCIRDFSFDFRLLIDAIPNLECPPDSVEVEDSCYRLFDINQADSCPDSTQDSTFVLPNRGQQSQSVCQVRPDGSRCQYDLSDDGQVFISNFEGNCYANDLENYDDSNVPQPVESGAECQSLGLGNFACLASESDTCSPSGICPSGCGNVAVGGADPVFVCITGDDDGDGTANFIDPDFQGTDPRNGNPTDDGDPDGNPDGGPDGNGGGTTNINVTVDNSGVESRINQSNSLLGEIASNTADTSAGLGTANQTLTEISDALTSTEAREEGEGLTTDISTIAGQSADELNLRQLTGEDTAFVETAFGTFAASSCQNPVFGQATLDFCSQSTRVLTVAEFGLWLLLVYFIWTELHEVLRRGRGG